MSDNQMQNAAYGNLTDPAFVARVTGADIDKVREYLPRIIGELKKRGVSDRETVIAALATAMTESGRLKWLEEGANAGPRGQERYLATKPYANVDPETGQRYYGRGIIQLTHKYNYDQYGKRLGIDLVHDPKRATDPDVASAVLADYIVSHNIPELAKEGDWKGVRRRVNGGLNNYTEFKQYVDDLGKGDMPSLPSESAKTAYGETESVIAQAQKLEMAGDWVGAHKLVNDQIWRISHPRGLIVQLEQEDPKGNTNAIAYLKRQVERYQQGQLPGSGRPPQPPNTDEPMAGNASEWTDDSYYTED
ncbi:MAG TPA: glycoside hydrolase family 19 protein [Armatimonadota bacterium]|jgi:predicted chitinase